MSNVTVTASGDVGLEVEVLLGYTSRKKHSLSVGESVELVVGGSQNLCVRAGAVVEEEVSAAEAEGDLPVGVDVTEEASARVSEDAEGNTLEPGVDVFPEDGQPVPPIDGQEAEVAVEAEAVAPVVEDYQADKEVAQETLGTEKNAEAPAQSDLFADNPFEQES